MRTFKLITVILLLCAINMQISAQSKVELTLKQAVEYALQNKIDAKKAKLQIENSEYKIQEARAGILPSVKGNFSLNYSPILQESALPGDMLGAPGTVIMIPFGQKWNSIAGVSLNQNIFNQSVFTGLKAARTTREFYQINSELTDEQIIERVATAYYNVFVYQEQLNTIQNNYQIVEKTKNTIKGLLDNGLAKQIDYDRINVQLINISTSRQQLINNVQLQENALKFYMGMPISQSIELNKEEFVPDNLFLENEINTDNRTEMKLLKKQEELLQLQKEAYKAAYYPTVGLSANYNYQGLGEKFPIGANKSQGVYWSDYSMISLAISIPIFNGLATKAKVNQANIELRSLQEDIKDTKLSLDLEYQNAKYQIENNLIAIKNQTENVSLAQKVVDNTQNNYLQGLATLTDLLESQNTLVDAKNNYSNAILQLKLAEVQLLKSKGELNTLLK